MGLYFYITILLIIWQELKKQSQMSSVLSDGYKEFLFRIQTWFLTKQSSSLYRDLKKNIIRVDVNVECNSD